jgi:polysaccharide deacetylase family protein (PEP-CTERM system associated)
MVNAMSVDVEDYFQVSAFENHVDKDNWSSIPCRVEANIERVLSLFDNRGVKGTFFTLGWIADRYPEMVRKIVAHGHELASHGWEHTRVTEQTQEQFRSDVDRTKKKLEDIAGQEIKGYRAASYSIGRDNLWALDVLAETGHKYSSSIVPISHDLYGMPGAPRFPFRVGDNELLEIPITTTTLAGRNINCGGGGWFRLFPYPLSRWAIRRVNTVELQPAIFYFHPWEIDPRQPRVPGISAKTRFRHYLNLGKMHSRLDRLLDDFQWGRVDEVFRIGTENGYLGH